MAVIQVAAVAAAVVVITKLPLKLRKLHLKLKRKVMALASISKAHQRLKLRPKILDEAVVISRMTSRKEKLRPLQKQNSLIKTIELIYLALLLDPSHQHSLLLKLHRYLQAMYLRLRLKLHLKQRLKSHLKL